MSVRCWSRPGRLQHAPEAVAGVIVVCRFAGLVAQPAPRLLQQADTGKPEHSRGMFVRQRQRSPDSRRLGRPGHHVRCTGGAPPLTAWQHLSSHSCSAGASYSSGRRSSCSAEPPPLLVLMPWCGALPSRVAAPQATACSCCWQLCSACTEQWQCCKVRTTRRSTPA